MTYRAGTEVVLTVDYTAQGTSSLIAISYPHLAKDVGPGSKILIADGSLSLVVTRCDVEEGLVYAQCQNTAMIGERKNCNLPGVVVDLPTLTAKDVEDIQDWAVPNGIDFLAPSFVRKESDVQYIRRVLADAGDEGGLLRIISKIENQARVSRRVMYAAERCLTRCTLGPGGLAKL